MREMKDSGIEWIGDVPFYWDLTKAKHVFLQRNERGNDNEVLLSATQQYGMVPQETLDGVVQTKEDTDLQTFKTVHINDYVISLRSFQGGFEASAYEGVCSPAYQVFHNIKEISHEYYRYLFKSDGFIEKMNSLTVGIREGKNIQFKDFAQSTIPYPPLEEQKKIALYLNIKCNEIDSIISKQEAIIEKLKEYKLSVITEAVTKGVNINVEMKDSGIEWIGTIPIDWYIVKLSTIAKTSSGATPNRSNFEENFIDANIRWIRTLDLNDWYVYDSSEKITESALSKSSCQIMPVNTVCVAMYGGAGTIGKCGLLKEEAATNQAICSIVTGCKMRPEYLLLQLHAIRKYWMKYAAGTRKDPNISQEIVSRMKVVLPPVDVQEEIIKKIMPLCEIIDTQIRKVEDIIEKQKEFKKSLIYEVVTGKKEV